MELPVSRDACRILDTLETHGYTAYIVGGAVRDLLLGKAPHDYDIATSALPFQVKAIFKRTVDTGLSHGTVTVLDGKTACEVTTFRTDGNYQDCRHPEQVFFVDSIEADLARRDFTVNAMAYHPERGLTDPYGGREDLEKKLLRTVGNPELRFREDALRMLRAVRLSATMDFSLDEETFSAIRKCALLIRRISAERARTELDLLLCSPHPERLYLLHESGLMRYLLPEVEACFGVEQKNKYHIYDVGRHILEAVIYTPCESILRWAALLHDIGKPLCQSTDANGIIHFYGHHRESVRLANDILHRFRMEHSAISDILTLIENHDVRIDATLPGVKRMMAKTGASLFDKLLLLQEADNHAKNMQYFEEKKARLTECRRLYRQVLSEHQPYLLSDLAVGGRDLIRIGFRPGKELGDVLKALLDEILLHPEKNRQDYLLPRARELRKMKGTIT